MLTNNKSLDGNALLIDNNEKLVKISLVNNVKDKLPKDTELTIEEFEQLMTTFPEEITAKKQAKGFIGGHFNGKRRKKENIAFRSLIVLDLDKCKTDLSVLEHDIEQDLSQYRYIAYSTASHAHNAPKVRIVLFPEEVIEATSYKTIVTNIINKLDKLKEYVDVTASTTPSQIMLLPIRTSKSYQPWTKLSDGENVDPSLFLYTNDNHFEKKNNEFSNSLHNIPLQLTTTDVNEHLASYPAVKCDYHDWLQVGTALHHQYLGDNEGLDIWHQWSKVDASRYKSQEINYKWSTFTNNNPNPLTFATIIQKAKVVANNAFGDISERKAIKWVDVTGGKNPAPKTTIENFKLLLAVHDINIRFNQITHSRDIMFWNNRESNKHESNKEGNDITRIKSICERYSIKSQSLIESYITVIANENAYNPFKEIIESIQWDGVSRLNDFYNTVIVAPEYEEIKKIYLKKWILQMLYLTCLNNGDIGMVGRQVLVFQGRQGLGKTTWFKSLLPQNMHHFLIDGVKLDLNNDMSIKNCIEKVFVELGELGSTFRKSDQDSLKAFISKNEDSLNIKYLAHHQVYRRRTSFFASVNDRNFLQDKTGNSRFLVLPVLSINYNKVDMLQLYAELLAHAKKEQARRAANDIDTPEYELSKEETYMQTNINEEYTSISPIAELIEKRFNFDQDPVTQPYTNHMLAYEILEKIDYPNKTKREANEVAQILDNKGIKRGNKKINGFYLPDVKSIPTVKSYPVVSLANKNFSLETIN